MNGRLGELVQMFVVRLTAGWRGLPRGGPRQPEHGPAITLDLPEAAESLWHGDALTIYKAQGLTATRALVVGDGLTRQSAYTALSRGRTQNQLYLHDAEGQRPDVRTPVGRLIDQLQRPNGHTLALHQLAEPVESGFESVVRAPGGEAWSF